jgi:sugar phosphate isomerase/epimerase
MQGPEGYEAIRPWIAHVHVKNAAVVDAQTGLTRWERVGGGDIDYAPILHRLQDDQYRGVIMLETHWQGDGLTKEESTRRSFADLKRLLST